MYKAALISVALLFAGATLYAKPPHAQGKGKPEKHYKKKHGKSDKFARKSKSHFSHSERYTFRNYYDNLPPGLAKKYRRTGELPPGWEKKVKPGMVLAPDLRRVAVPVPKELLETLAPGPVGSTVLRVHDHIIRVHQKSHEVLDSFMLHKRLR